MKPKEFPEYCKRLEIAKSKLTPDDIRKIISERGQYWYPEMIKRSRERLNIMENLQVKVCKTRTAST